MAILLRLLLIIGGIYFAYRMFFWIPQQLSSTVVCPKCEGKGHWYSIRHREDCKQCNGMGRLPK